MKGRQLGAGGDVGVGTKAGSGGVPQDAMNTAMRVKTAEAGLGRRCNAITSRRPGRSLLSDPAPKYGDRVDEGVGEHCARDRFRASGENAETQPDCGNKDEEGEEREAQVVQV